MEVRMLPQERVVEDALGVRRTTCIGMAAADGPWIVSIRPCKRDEQAMDLLIARDFRLPCRGCNHRDRTFFWRHPLNLVGLNA